MTSQELLKEFDRQVENLILAGYPKTAALSDQEFLNHLEPLREVVSDLKVSETNLSQGYLPFVIVIKPDLIPTNQAMKLAKKDEKNGVVILRPHTPQNFKTTEDVIIPGGSAYLLVDIDRGKETINLPPSEGLKIIKKSQRSPLTIDEGIAIITHYPDFLIKNNCFYLLASRTGVDKRVPAIWINAKKEPNLGWCWEGNPHTWLGSASCVNRVGLNGEFV